MQAKNRSGKREFNDKWEQDFLYLWGWDARILGIQKQDKGILRRAIKQVCGGCDTHNDFFAVIVSGRHDLPSDARPFLKRKVLL